MLVTREEEMLSVISIKWVKPRDAANHSTMDTGQPRNKE